MTNDKLELAIDLKKRIEEIDLWQDIMNAFAVPEDRIIKLFSRSDANDLAHKVSSFIQRTLSEQRENLEDEFKDL